MARKPQPNSTIDDIRYGERLLLWLDGQEYARTYELRHCPICGEIIEPRISLNADLYGRFEHSAKHAKHETCGRKKCIAESKKRKIQKNHTRGAAGPVDAWLTGKL